MKNRIFAFIATVILSLFCIVPAFAAEVVTGGNATANTNTSTNNSNTGTSYYGNVPSFGETASEILGQTGEAPSMDDVSNWIDRKGGEVISLSLRIAQIVVVVVTIISLILIVIGALSGNGRMLGGAVMALVFAVICYAFVDRTFFPTVLNAISSWIIS